MTIFERPAHVGQMIDRIKAVDYSTLVLDKMAIETALSAHLAALDQKARPVVWVRDLKAAAALFHKAASTSNGTWDAARAAAWDAAWDAARDAAWDAAWDAARDAAWAAAWDAARAAAWDAARAAAWAAAWDAARAAARAAAWAVEAEMLCAASPRQPSKEAAKWREICAPLLEAYHSGLGYYWIGPEQIVCCPRPLLLLDDRARLHCETGPAVNFSDGQQLYFWHGVRVPKFAVMEPQTITADRIGNESNAEVRRVLMERYGVARYLQDSGSLIEDHEEGIGTLYRKKISGDEDIVMVKVINSSPEPDGTFRIYTLRVPPTITRAREAVAWTFNLKPEEYRPRIET